MKAFNMIISMIIAVCVNPIHTHAEKCITSYHSNDFGYFIIDNEKETVNIFKYYSKENQKVTNVANCKIVKSLGNNCFYISSTQPCKDEDLIMSVIPKDESKPDSIRISITIPKNLKYEYDLFLEPSVGKPKIFGFSDNGKATFILPKYSFEYYNFFSICILPVVNPFRYHSSWGDNETLSFLDLRIEKYIDICNPKLSELDIIIKNFSDDIFTKWIIVDDYVIKSGKQILWKGIKFTEIDKTEY